MLKDIIKYRKIKDIFNFKEAEVVISLLITVLTCIMLQFLNIYEDFSLYIDLVSNVINCFIGGFLGIIGFALSGMAIVLGLFSKKQVDDIEKSNGKGVIEEIMSSYSFLAFVSSINIVLLLLVSFALFSKRPILSRVVFWCVAFIVIYLVMFNVFYAVALVFNCISLFVISKLYVQSEEEKILPIANEVRIDVILGVLSKLCNLSREDFLQAMNSEIEELPDEQKCVIREYFEKHYAKE